MKIIFYNNKEENIVVKKENITPLFEIDGTLREGCSIYNPVIQIKTYGKDFTNNGAVQSIELANLIKANYAYVEDFSRYYYIDDIIGEYSNVATLFLKCDVLMSFKDYFKELNVFANRNEYNWKPTLCDEKLPAYGLRYNNIYELDKLDLYDKGYCYTITLTTTSDEDAKYAAYNYGFNGSTLTTRTYVVSKKVLNYILNEITNKKLNFSGMFKDEPYQAVQSIRAFPFDISKYLDLVETKKISGTSPETGEKIEAYFLNFIGNELAFYTSKIDPEHSAIYELSRGTLTNVMTIEKFLSLNLNIYSDIDFINTNNYTKYKLYIPYYGIIDVDANYLFKYRSIRVIYNIDVISGNTTILVISGIRYILTCNVGIDVPITGSNANAKARNLTMGLINTAGAIAGLGAVTSMASVGGSTSTETSRYRYNKRGSISSVKRTQTEEPAEQQRKFDFNKTANFISKSTIDIMNSLVSSNCGGNVAADYSGYVYLLRSFLIFIERVDYYVPNGYAHLVGRPTDYSGKLKGLFGYTEIAGVHIEGDMGSSSQSEKEEIEQALKTGVILPNPQSTTPSENETW